MPELVQVARLVGRLKKYLVGKTLKNVTAMNDPVVFHGTTANKFLHAMEGRTVLDAKSLGKFSWLEMDKPPHPVIHLGIAGWIYFNNDPYSHYYAVEKPEFTYWPPTGEIFRLKVHESRDEAMLADPRRLARIRLMDCPREEIPAQGPLRGLGPDPLKTEITEAWLRQKFNKHVPARTLLADQENIAGLGSWMSEEILYQARIHPEFQGRKFNDGQFERVRRGIAYVVKTAHDVDSDFSQLPSHWLKSFRFDWRVKGQTVENGEPVAYTKHVVKSAHVPSAQIKSRIEKGPDLKKIKPTTDLLFEMKDPPRTRYRLPAEPLKPQPLVIRDDGDDGVLGGVVAESDCEDVFAPLEGERPLTAGDVFRPPPTKRSKTAPNLAIQRNLRGHWNVKNKERRR
ncbi:N-terminal domain of MutM-like DNA repair protein [Choiromyces venosus 120613-1]|uniref:N-terminal domain of MutM-like DNA repair protein n=1 Tax=Choiromyces venosus 120613-1 TaxID=1336337 RepID=A0A3N4JM53_9PEZI|nr:N-terminal domain of MutM-like DNA repair protein [Choiromyces venosus 120613-1]